MGNITYNRALIFFIIVVQLASCGEFHPTPKEKEIKISIRRCSGNDFEACSADHNCVWINENCQNNQSLKPKFESKRIKPDCLNILKKYLHPSKRPPIQSTKDIRDRFSLLKEFKGGFGKGNVYNVFDKTDGLIKVLKILPEDYQLSVTKSKPIREIYISCLVSEFPEFPKYFGSGIVDSSTPFASEKRRKDYYYYLMEFIEGDSLTTLAQKDPKLFDDPNMARNIIKNLLTGLSDAFNKFGFIHNDLHTGNIILGKDGKTKIIDFGKSSVLDFHQADKINMQKVRSGEVPTSRITSGNLLQFARNLGVSPLSFGAKSITLSKEYMGGQDIHFLNLLIYIFRQKSSNKANFPYCYNIDGCFKKYQ